MLPFNFPYSIVVVVVVFFPSVQTDFCKSSSVLKKKVYLSLFFKTIFGEIKPLYNFYYYYYPFFLPGKPLRTKELIFEGHV